MIGSLLPQVFNFSSRLLPHIHPASHTNMNILGPRKALVGDNVWVPVTQLSVLESNTKGHPTERIGSLSLQTKIAVLFCALESLANGFQR